MLSISLVVACTIVVSHGSSSLDESESQRNGAASSSSHPSSGASSRSPSNQLRPLAELLWASKPAVSFSPSRTFRRARFAKTARLGVGRPSMSDVSQSRRSVLAGALAVATLGFVPTAAFGKGPPTEAELAKLTLGLSRVDYLLDNWNKITTICSDGSYQKEDFDPKKDGARTLEGTGKGGDCEKDPLKVRVYIGATSVNDPLYKLDKVLLKARVLVPPEKEETYINLVEDFVTQQETTSGMAYTASWSGYENPGGSRSKVDEALKVTKTETIKFQAIMDKLVGILGLKKMKFDIEDFKSTEEPEAQRGDFR